MIIKECTVCGKSKTELEFFKRALGKFGLMSACKLCAIAAANDYRSKNSEKISDICAAYRKANVLKIKNQNSAYRKKNADDLKAKKAAWSAKNAEKIKIICAAWRAKNSERVIANRSAWHAKNPGAHRTESVRINRQNRRAREINAGGVLSKGLAERLFKLQKGKCPCCGKPLGSSFHMDHKMPLALGGSNTDDNIQLLRGLCNKQKSARHPVDFMQARGFLL